MRVEQSQWTAEAGWSPGVPGGELADAHLVMVFGSRATLGHAELRRTIRAAFPDAHIIGGSTAGEIHGTRVQDDSLVVTAIHFEHTHLNVARARIDQEESSAEVGRILARSMSASDLAHVFVLSDGLGVNGSDLVAGMTEELPPDVTMTGGLAGDGAAFERTVLLWGEEVESGTVVAVGLCGDRLRVGYGSLGGWDPFGPERVITRSEGNVLYELDGRSALQLYKTYLGHHADGLPAAGLLFPLALRSRNTDRAVVRTILSVDEEHQSLTFAGDVPQGHYARLMKANFDRLIDGAANAARVTQEALGDGSPDLAILISCVGRKMVLKQRVEEEVEAVRDVLGGEVAITGFYSYGEISPFTPSAPCELHNQTMTITTLSER